MKIQCGKGRPGRYFGIGFVGVLRRNHGNASRSQIRYLFLLGSVLSEGSGNGVQELS